MGEKLKLLHMEIENLKNQRYKLFFLLPETMNKTELIKVLNGEGIPTVNIGLYLSDQLRFVSSDRRPFELAKWLRKVINDQKNDVVCIYNIEYLFDSELRQNPIKLMEAHSGNTILLVLWPGKIENKVLSYATPEHPEYFQNSEYSNNIMIY